MKLTKNIPLIVWYIFVEIVPFKNSFVRLLKGNSFTNNRIAFYLSEGSFGIDDDRIEYSIEEISPDQH